MQLGCDVVLLGTGVAPLVAAFSLLSEGKSVLLLNPEWDFFCEKSEFPLDPLWPITPHALTPARLLESSPERALSILRPNYPGSIEYWPNYEKKGFHDLSAPHVRYRDRVWIRSPLLPPKNTSSSEWDLLEAMYIEASDAGLNPRILEGVAALRAMPGCSSKNLGEKLRGILVPKLCDVDVLRYRNGLLEFLRERLGNENCVVAASQIELTKEGIRYYFRGKSHSVSLRDGLMVFWTPSLTSWIFNQSKLLAKNPPKPLGVRFWEEWTLMSRDLLDIKVVGTFEEMCMWAEVEGFPEMEVHADPTHLHRLTVLKGGSLVPWQIWKPSKPQWISSESFDALSRLCHEFLGWEYFSVRSLRTRALFEWPSEDSNHLIWKLSDQKPRVHIVCGGDGPLVQTVRKAREACEILLKGS